jgi:hypothetical protein
VDIRVTWTETCTYSQVIEVPDGLDLADEVARDEALLAAIAEQGNHASAFQSCSERDVTEFEEHH